MLYVQQKAMDGQRPPEAARAMKTLWGVESDRILKVTDRFLKSDIFKVFFLLTHLTNKTHKGMFESIYILYVRHTDSQQQYLKKRGDEKTRPRTRIIKGQKSHHTVTRVPSGARTFLIKPSAGPII